MWLLSLNKARTLDERKRGRGKEGGREQRNITRTALAKHKLDK